MIWYNDLAGLVVELIFLDRLSALLHSLPGDFKDSIKEHFMKAK